MVVYAELDARLNDLIAERGRRMEACRDHHEYEELVKYYHYEIDKNAAHEPVEQGYVVSKLYFAISMKWGWAFSEEEKKTPRTTITTFK